MPETGGIPFITPDLLAALAGIVLSLAFSYIPRLSDWYAALDGTEKRLIMGACIIAVGAGVALLSCNGWADWVICDRPGLMGLASNIIWALISNQTMHRISPEKYELQTFVEQLQNRGKDLSV